MKLIKHGVLVAAVLLSSMAGADDLTIQTRVHGTITASGAASAPADIDTGLNSPETLATKFFDYPITTRLSVNATGTIYAGIPNTPLAYNGGQSFNVSGGAGVVFATIYKPGNTDVLTPSSGVVVPGTGFDETRTFGIKITPQGFFGAFGDPVTITFRY